MSAGPFGKKECWWDEYVVTITNIGDHSVTLVSAALVDFEGENVAPGDDPWQLDRLSRQWYESAGVRHARLGLEVLRHPVTTLTGTGVVLGALAGGSSAVAAGAVATGAMVALPAFVVRAAMINSNNKEKVAGEFSRRRVGFPSEIPADGNTVGSLFFRITPGPQRLVLTFRSGALTCDVVVELTPLAGLHFRKRVYSGPQSLLPSAAAGPKVSCHDFRQAETESPPNAGGPTPALGLPTKSQIADTFCRQFSH